MVEQSADLEQTLAAYDFELPREQIAQVPAPERDGARLMVLPEATEAAPVHSEVRSLARWLRAGDLLVLNATRVLPARLRGHKSTGGAAEALLLDPVAGDPRSFRALVKQRGRLRVGMKFTFASALDAEAAEAKLGAEICALQERGEVTLRFGEGPSPYAIGEMPLPPYIERGASPSSEKTRDLERYQTVFARVPGAVAAPTAGLHLTRSLLSQLAEREIQSAEVVLHVGAGTFRPLDAAALASGRLHAERFELPEATARAIARTRERGGRVVAVGTTTTRVLESCAQGAGLVEARAASTELFLRPGDRFRVVDALLTNFHLPRSSLLMLVAAFAGRARVLAAYREAVARGYRFFSYGDAMLMLGRAA